MIRGHQMLEQLYLQVLDAMSIEGPTLRELWTKLDDELRAHMEAEERFVLPKLAHVDRDEAASLRSPKRAARPDAKGFRTSTWLSRTATRCVGR